MAGNLRIAKYLYTSISFMFLKRFLHVSSVFAREQITLTDLVLLMSSCTYTCGVLALVLTDVFYVGLCVAVMDVWADHAGCC